jgi:DNA invertase Pin-like site-specific DNA recombinase
MTTTLAYRRVSTDRQAEQGYGLDAQAAALETWAEAAGLPIAETFTDAGVSGSIPPVSRPGFSALLTRLAASNAGDGTTGGNEGTLAVVLPRLDRLARDLLIQEQALADLWATGATVYDASTGQAIHPDDPDDPTRTLIRQVLGAVAQYDRAAIGARMRAGRAAKRRAGGYADGAPPFGWRAVGGELVEDPGEQATLARMIHLRDSGLSLRVIGDVLAREGHQPRRADRFHPKVLAYILNREQLRKVTT